MALGTLDRTPPPFFRQGPSSLTKLSFCSALAVFLMVADGRFAITQPIRATVATVLYPLQRALLMPVEVIDDGRNYLGGLAQAVAAEQSARSELARLSERAQRAEQLSQENARLRALLELRPTLDVRSQPAEVLYEAADPYSRKVIIDRGVTHNVVLGSPVVNEAGEVVAAVADRLDRHQQGALQRVEHRRHGRPDRLGDAEAAVGDHQEHGQRRAKRELRQRRGALTKEGRRRAIEGAERHVELARRERLRPGAGPPQARPALQAAALRDATPPRAVHAGTGRHGAAALGPLGGQGAKRPWGSHITLK